jgi:hypothetical protein
VWPEPPDGDGPSAVIGQAVELIEALSTPATGSVHKLMTPAPRPNGSLTLEAETHVDKG